MQYEVHFPDSPDPDSFWIGCKSCTTLALSRVPGAYANPEPAAPDCELRYYGCDDSKREV